MSALILSLTVAGSMLSAQAADDGQGIPIVSGEPARTPVSEFRAQPQAAITAPAPSVPAAAAAAPAAAAPSGAAPIAAAPAPAPDARGGAAPVTSVSAAVADGRRYYSAALDRGVEQALMQTFLEASGQTLLSGDAEHPDPELLQAVGTAVASMHIAGDSLSVSFEQDRMEEVVRTCSDRLYGGISSPVMAFIVVNRPSGNRVINQESGTPFLSLLNEQARRLSFNVLYPLMDLKDLQLVIPEAILGHDDQALARAAARYDAGYFISAALKPAGGDQLSVVWNLYDRRSTKLHGATSMGRAEEVAAQIASAVARAVHARTVAGPAAAAETVPAEDAFALGPRRDAVRVAVSNVNSLNDLIEVNTALITYGFDGEGQIVGIRGGAVYMDIPTSAAPDILDGSMSHARDFRKTGEWQYEWMNSTGH